MFFIDTDFAEGKDDGTFTINLKSGGNGLVCVKVYATSGMTAKKMYPLDYFYTTSGNGWFTPIGGGIADASQKGLPGIASAAIASGCTGWVTVRGVVEDASSPASVDFTGSIGHAITWWGGSGMSASTSSYEAGAIHQIGILLESPTGATNAANIFLTGKMYAESI